MGSIDKKIFTGGLNRDQEQRLVQQGDYRDALNIRVAESEEDSIGTVQNLKGLEKINPKGFSIISQDLGGDESVIGAYQDKRYNRVIYFICDSSSNNYHKLV